jgi:nitroreductase
MSIIETIRARRSCRTYRDRPIEPDRLAELKPFLEANRAAPFGSPLRFQLLDLNDLEADELRPLGTYGVIKGAKLFIIGAVGKEPKAMEDYGYCMEKNILKATALGLGTCWLGGTFRRSGFARRVNLSDGELLPAISPVGYAGEKRSLTDRFFLFSAGSNERKEWNELFSEGDPETPLPRESCGGYETPLECVRTGPSASNKQPWRIVRDGSAFLFYLAKTPGYDRMIKEIRLQNIDMGIAMCHFELSARELGLVGCWNVADPRIPSGGREYIVSWIAGG